MKILLVRACWIPLALAAALTTGCASPEALRQADESKCNGFGFHPGTDGFATCMQKLAADRESNSPFSAANIAAAAAHSVVPAVTCAGTHNDSSATTGNSASTTTGLPGNSTTTGTSSSETNSSGTSFSACVGN